MVNEREDGTADPADGPDEDQISREPYDDEEVADPVVRLPDPERSQAAREFVAALRESLIPHLEAASGSSVSVQGNFFLGDTELRDAVAGDKHVAGQATAFSGRVDSGRVPDHVLTAVRGTFVASASYDSLRRTLMTRTVVMVRAAPGRGTTTRVLHLLDGESPDGVWKLNPDVRLDVLTGGRIRRNGGYLAEELELEQAARLRPFHFERLQRLFAERDSRLVITVDAAAPLREESLNPWLFDVDDAPDPHALVARHVAWHLDVDPDGTETAFLKEPPVQELIESVSATDAPVRRMADLAALLTRVRTGEMDLGQVAEWAADESDERLRAWFSGQDGLEQRCFVLSLGVFHGMSENVITRVARPLTDLIRAVDAPEEHQPPGVFGTPRRQRLAAAGAETFEAVEPTPHGPVSVTCLRFANRQLATRVVRHVWQEYEAARQPLLTWLAGLATDPDRRVRLRAGTTAGLIGLDAFDRVRSEFLLEHAGAVHAWQREVVLGALQVPARDPRLAPLVSRVIADWGQPTRPWPLRWTAARALGASVGRTIPDRALRMLGRLAADSDGRLTGAVGDSVTELFLDEEKDLTAMVLNRLLAWTDPEADDGTAELRRAGVACFLQLCFDVRVETAAERRSWPAVLWLTTVDPRHLRRVTTLMRRTLDTPHLLHSGYQLLRRWVTVSRRERRILDSLGVLIAELAAGDKDGGMLRGCLTEWRTEDAELVPTIDVLLTALDSSDLIDGKAAPR